MIETRRPRRISGKRARVEPLEERRLLSGVVTTVTSFNASAVNPNSLVVDSAGNLYGLRGSAMFEVPKGTQTPLPLLAFAANGLILDPTGNLYAYGDSGVFEVAAGTHAVSTLSSPIDVDDLTSDANGTLYGLARPGNGSTFELFKIDSGTHALRILFATTNEVFGFGQFGLSIDAAGDAYWVSYGDLVAQIFEVAAGSQVPKPIDSIGIPESGLVPAYGYQAAADPEGNIYLASGASLYKIAAKTQKSEELTTPTQTAISGLIVDTAGNLFAISSLENLQLVFETNPATGTGAAPVLFRASSEAFGLFPSADGDLYIAFVDSAGEGKVLEATGTGFVPASNSALSVVAQPADETSIATHTVSFSAAVGGFPDPGVQWQRSVDGGRTFTDISGNASATTPTLTLTGLQNDENGTQYRAIFTNSLGTLTTSPAALTLLPTISLVSPAHASPLDAIGTPVTLSALGETPTGESGLRYSWSVLRAPAGAAQPSFSTNDSDTARQVVATFHKDGRYLFRCTISDGLGDTLRTDVPVEVTQVASSLRLTPHDKSVAINQPITFHATVYDQFGHPLRSQPAIQYALVSGSGAINASTGVFSSPTAGAALIQAEEDDLSGVAGLQIFE